MTAVIRCECGWEHTAESRDDLVEAMQQHIAAEHPGLPEPPSPTDILAMAAER